MFHLADEDSRSATGTKTFGAVAAADSPDDAAFFLELVHKVSGQGLFRCRLAPALTLCDSAPCQLYPCVTPLLFAILP